jgi:tetraacyldisaccharide 4'-kinase
LSVTSLAANESLDQSSLEGERVGLLSGIAHPSSFRKTVEALGAEVVAERRFPDHHRYRPRDLAGLSKEAPLWLTTEKDGVKILSSWGGSEHIRVVRSRVLLEDESGFFDWLESRLLPAPEPG